MKTDLQRILKECHDNAFSGGHFGRDKTFYRVREKFFWNGMKDEDMDYVRNCEKCPLVNVKNIAEQPELHPIPVPYAAWRLVTIDLIGPLKETPSGNKYICAATFPFSKWSEAKAIPNKEMSTICSFMKDIIYRYLRNGTT